MGLSMNEKPMVFTERMPANVALIGHLFSPTCLAFSLPKLHTTVSLTAHKGTKDTWKISNTERLSYQSIDGYLKHLQMIKKEYGYEGGFFVQSNNSFPMGLGLSSSSSSFSALTACAVKAITAKKRGEIKKKLTNEEIAILSGYGKKSSQHSFYSPWSICADGSMVGASFSEFDQLSHVALVVSDQQKRVSIDQVLTLIEQNTRSGVYKENTKNRVLQAQEYIQNKNWKGLFHCVWEDFIELHALFHSSKPSFSFQNDATMSILEQVKRWWDIYDDGPILIMGIGRAVHLIFRKDQAKMKTKMLATLKFMHCIEGTGSNDAAVMS